MVFAPKLAAALLIFAPTLTFAQEHTFTPLPAPAERPYPFEILGLQPGDSLDDVMAVFAERSDTAPSDETEVISVQSPDGRSLEFTYRRSRQIGGLSLNERMAEVNFPENVVATLTSDVMQQRPVSITRSMRLPTGELPTAQALQAQTEETYGPPSRIETNSGYVSLIYAWSDEGFIADLNAQTPREITYKGWGGRVITESYLPCQRTSGNAYDTTTEYTFDYPRSRELFPGCVAIFRVSHTTKPGSVSISFTLDDFDLARQHRAELDRQIVEALTGEEDVEPSKMEL